MSNSTAEPQTPWGINATGSVPHAAVSFVGKPETVYFLILLVSVAIVLLFRLGEAPPTVHSEVRCWSVVSGMAESGDWLVPRRDGEAYFNKPPLFFWIATAVSQLARGASYATLRLPSVAAALLLVLLTFLWARSIAGPVVGLVAAGALVLMRDFIDYGRLGAFEMLLALLCNAALVTFDVIQRTRNRRLVPVFFILVLAGFLTKGPVAIMIVGVPVILFLWSEGRLRRALTFRVFAWALLMIPPALAWFAILAWRLPGAADRFFSEVVLTMGVETADHSAEHFEPLYYYFPRIFVVAMPVALLLPLVVRRGWATRFWRESPRMRYCAWIVAGLVVAFSLFAKKRSFYLLPLFPAMAILIAESSVWAATAHNRVRRLWLAIPGALVGLMGLAMVPLAAMFLRIIGASTPVMILACLALGVCVVTLLFAVVRRRWQTAGVALLAMYLMFCLMYFGSLRVWRSAFETGTVAQRADYDPAFWERLRSDHPLVSRAFHNFDSPKPKPGLKNRKSTEPPATVPESPRDTRPADTH
jgi:4-amino-4-deoxy-L-arabinose transferase-like glycosyltransferase